jgi:hypothetical protein
MVIISEFRFIMLECLIVSSQRVYNKCSGTRENKRSSCNGNGRPFNCFEEVFPNILASLHSIYLATPQQRHKLSAPQIPLSAAAGIIMLFAQ